jgi:hypothetical protein
MPVPSTPRCSCILMHHILNSLGFPILAGFMETLITGVHIAYVWHHLHSLFYTYHASLRFPVLRLYDQTLTGVTNCLLFWGSNVVWRRQHKATPPSSASTDAIIKRETRCGYTMRPSRRSSTVWRAASRPRPTARSTSASAARQSAKHGRGFIHDTHTRARARMQVPTRARTHGRQMYTSI